MKDRKRVSNKLKALTVGALCLLCGLLIGYQAHSIRQHSRKINLRLRNHSSSLDVAPQVSAEHVRQQYRYLQPAGSSAISMHTVVPTGCDRWQDFQMAGLYWSFLR